MLNVKFNRSTCNIDIYNHNCNKISSTFIWLLNAILNLLVKRNQIWLWHKISPLPYESKLTERHPSGQISAVHLCPAVLGRGGTQRHTARLGAAAGGGLRSASRQIRKIKSSSSEHHCPQQAAALQMACFAAVCSYYFLNKDVSWRSSPERMLWVPH